MRSAERVFNPISGSHRRDVTENLREKLGSNFANDLLRSLSIVVSRSHTRRLLQCDRFRLVECKSIGYRDTVLDSSRGRPRMMKRFCLCRRGCHEQQYQDSSHAPPLSQ